MSEAGAAERGPSVEPHEPEVASDTPFVGRGHYLDELKTNFKSRKVFGIFGIRAVGKSRLVEEFVKWIQAQNLCLREKVVKAGTEKQWVPVRTITVNLRLHEGIDSLYSFVCSALGVVPNMREQANIKQSHIVREFANRKNERFMLVFDNAEDVVEKKEPGQLLNLVLDLAKRCRNVKIFITSTTKVQFASLGHAVFCLELLPLTPTKSAELLRRVAPTVKWEDNLETIVKLSEGLPLLILMIGAEMQDSSMTARQMVETLANFRLEALSGELYPPEKRAADVYRGFIERLSEIYQQRFAVLGYIPGTFDSNAAKEILGHDTVAMTKHETLIPIRRRHMLTYSASTQRFDIQGILRECLTVYFTIKDLPGVRDRYIQTFSRLMVDLANQMGTREYAAAVFRFSLEQPNLSKLLSEVMYSTEDNYRFFVQVARSCTAMIERYMTHLSDQFYEGCMKMVDSFGRYVDKASIHVAIGSLESNAKGDFPLGEMNYRSAIQILQPHGASLLLVTAYQKLGWNLHNQGRSHEALGWLKKSLDMSGNQHPEVAVATLSAMGVVYNWIGDYNKALAVSEKTLAQRKTLLGEEHAEVAISLNNLGLLYDQVGQSDKALLYFQEGLRLKKKNIKTVTSTVVSVVASLSNVANKYTSMKQFDEAKKHLDEAMEMINNSDKPHKGALSLTYNSYGKMYKAMGELEKATEMFETAVNIRKDIMMDSIPYIGSVINLAGVLKERKKYTQVVVLLNEILERKEKGIKSMPHNDFVLKCLELKADIYKEKQMPVLHAKVVDDMETELLRLRKVFTARSKQDKADEMDRRLQELRLSSEGTGDFHTE